MHVIAHEGVWTHVRESAGKLTLGEKSLAAPGNRTCVSGMVVRCSNQVSYIPTLHEEQKSHLAEESPGHEYREGVGGQDGLARLPNAVADQLSVSSVGSHGKHVALVGVETRHLQLTAVAGHLKQNSLTSV